jgi:hypothetical protein
VLTFRTEARRDSTPHKKAHSPELSASTSSTNLQKRNVQLPVLAGRTAPRAASRRGGKMRCGCRPWCCREMRCSGKMRWRCRVRRSSEMRHCRRMRLGLWPECWMGRHHQMPCGHRRPGDVRPNSGALRSRLNQMPHRCRSLFKLQPRRLMPRGLKARCRLSHMSRAGCGRLCVPGRWHSGETLSCCTCGGGWHCGYRPTRMGGYHSRPCEASSMRCGCDSRMAVVL